MVFETSFPRLEDYLQSTLIYSHNNNSSRRNNPLIQDHISLLTLLRPSPEENILSYLPRGNNQLIQDTIEEHFDAIPEHLLPSLITQLNITKEIGTKHSPGYFILQASKMAPKASPATLDSLTHALASFQESDNETSFGDYLKRFQKQGFNIPDAEAQKYSVRCDIQLENSRYGHVFKYKYFDTVFNFCLTYNGALIASVGFDVTPGKMYIRQIQGIKRNGDRLKPFKWERALVNYAVEWAQRYGIPQVAIMSVENNKWAKVNGHLDKDQGKMRYDVTAKRCGFKERDQHGNYIKILQPTVFYAPHSSFAQIAA